MAVDIKVNGNLQLKSYTPSTQINLDAKGDTVKAEVVASGANLDVNNADAEIVLITKKNGGTVTSDGAGELKATIWGDNLTVNALGRSADIQSLDQAIVNGEYTEYKKDANIKTETTTERTLSNLRITDDSIFNKLSDREKKIAESIDWTSTKNGNPKYLLNKAPDGQYHVYVTNDGKLYTAMQSGLPHKAQSFSWNGEKSTFGEIKTLQNETVMTTITSTFENMKNTTLNFGFGDYKANVSTDKSTLTITNPETDDSINIAEAPTVITHPPETHRDVEGSIKVYSGGIAKWHSPLIVDSNRDNDVSAASGIGVDIDGDGIADGAATNGDKMLAMSDLNGNGNVDGTEVFGNNTVNPFTKEKINASNGFEALKEIAVSAEKYTGMKIFNGDDVDLKKLNSALKTVGVTLGLISDSNVTNLESLGDLKSINVGRYIENDNAANETQDSDIEHRQLGSATFEDGTSWSVHDVWFASRSACAINSRLDRLYRA